MNRVLKVALLGGLAVSLASCSTVRGALPFGLGGKKEPQATATAGQMPSSSVGNGGLEPFMPDAHSPTDTQNFGFTPNVSFKLKCGNGNRNTTCAGE